MEKLEEVAPSKKRQRSEFVRMAIVKALMDEQELRTAAAYRRVPDDPTDTYLDHGVWEGLYLAADRSRGGARPARPGVGRASRPARSK
ncbi:MAG: hypothetical protein U0166_08395 [Acidobacteriota bacterium]